MKNVKECITPLNESLLLNNRKDNNKVHTSPLVSVLIEAPEREPTILSLESTSTSTSPSTSASASNKIGQSYYQSLSSALVPLSLLLSPSKDPLSLSSNDYHDAENITFYSLSFQMSLSKRSTIV
mmetsp:Transcript_50621/g.56558  ORF Transcript_50621/g.56558 Transcript_50621/m.56558 type:complete len:125 (-) Transcript_50621:776-1150(-)